MSDASAALPLEPHEGLATVAVTGEFHAALLVSQPLHATILRTALPAVASSLLMTLFFSVDTYWIGTRVGSDGLAAASTSLFWIWMVVSVAEMVSVGLTAVAARRHGEGKAEEASCISGDAFLLALALGAIIAAIGIPVLPGLFSLMDTPSAVTALGVSYLKTYLAGAPLIFGFFAVDSAFRAAGDTRTPFLLLTITVGVTLLLDPALIMGWWGLPALGMKGAAIATLATRSVACVLGVYLLWKRKLMRFRRPDPGVLAAICRVGLPTAVTGVFFSLIYVALTRTTTRFGTPALAALGIGHRVESWLFMIGVGFSAAVAAIVGQNLGAGRADRARRAGWIAVGWCSMFGLVACALELLIPERFASLFTHDPAVIAESARYLRIASIAQLGVCAEIVLEGALGGAGYTLPPMITSSSLTALRVPVAAWAARFGSVGIWWTISLTALGRALAMVALWKSDRWAVRKV
ncbi:MAG: efflux family protein [Gemmatimonadetes bacterium]|nr:efflux family protein [Gemmatimonadota bacterium]